MSSCTLPLARILSLDRCNVKLWAYVRRNMLHKVVIDIAKWIKAYPIITVWPFAKRTCRSSFGNLKYTCIISSRGLYGGSFLCLSDDSNRFLCWNTPLQILEEFSWFLQLMHMRLGLAEAQQWTDLRNVWPPSPHSINPTCKSYNQTLVSVFMLR